MIFFQSAFPLQTDKNAPADEGSINASLLTRGGFVKKESAGVFSYLPLGLRVLRKIEQIVREEMNNCGMTEVLMPALVPKENFEKTGRAKVDIAFAPSEKYILGWSHEEVITPMAKTLIKSYKNLPLALYQIQTKFRNEPRAKSGLLRGREFLMKDAYSFHVTREDLEEFYEKAAAAYFRVFARAGLKSYRITAGGGEFSDKVSHEFSVITPAGEDLMIYCEKCGFAQNTEIGEIEGGCPTCGTELQKTKCVEAGNIFDLGQKYARDFDLKFTDQNGEQQIPHMGCYGIGVSRLLGTIVEAFNDENGIIWPKTVAPFQIHVVSLRQNAQAEKIAADLTKEGFEVLLDDRDETPGKKFADSDLIGIPLRLVVSERTLAEKAVEWKERARPESEKVAIEDLRARVRTFFE